MAENPQVPEDQTPENAPETPQAPETSSVVPPLAPSTDAGHQPVSSPSVDTTPAGSPAHHTPPAGPPAGEAPRAAAPGTPDASGKPEKKRSMAAGMVAVAAVAALVGGAVGAGVVALNMDNGSVVATNDRVGTNLMINDVDNATVISGVAAKVAPSVVTLSVTGGSASGTGSGVILTEDGYIVTNAHVATLSGATSDPTIKVQSYDGRLFNATLVGSDPIADLAVVKVESDVTFQPAEFANSNKLNVGDIAIAIGAPLGLANTVTSGVISALNRSITVASSEAPDTEEAPDPDDGQNGFGPFDFWQFDNGQGNSGSTSTSTTIALPVIQTDAAINPGNSGGALVDEDGKVIGINVAIASTGTSSSETSGNIGVGFAIPSNLAKRVAFDIINDGSTSHGLLGAMVADVTDDPSLADSDTTGAAIQDVTPGGPAEKAGLKAGDLITEFNGIPVTGKTDLTAQVRVLPGGDEAEVTYIRGGKSYTTTVTLDSLQ
ncbi:S1C family serine protease [Salinibacterium hongtaonis]|uniref:PDZ domain-containing protein n=1 Tax=Homoserinimonas hongtaonis TaxID=2079791 RepID=A0A2U1SX03_9MICO|nr:trypsin-like peptidase domain-containing protein [Salinibacterium hongtaonis]AWB88719.1 serine protease [Salinibacterium hongtaonis]PWB96129.1 PDZ domain-containing protein [Salinibacterium hongtaonis]